MKSKRTDTLLSRMDEARISNNKFEYVPRNFFRGSEVGHCSNQINFRRRAVEIESRDDFTKSRFLEDGHLHQAVLSAELKASGVRVTGEEAEAIKRVKVGSTIIKIKAHKDGTIKLNGEECLFEAKSLKTDNFMEIVRSGDIARFYDQIQMYLFLYKYDKCFLIIVDRNTSSHQEFTIRRDTERIRTILKKLGQIEKDIQNESPSSRDYPRNSRECGWCPYFKACWGVDKGFRDRTHKGKTVEVEGRKESRLFERALELYLTYRQLKKETTEVKAEADEIMSILLKKFKATKLCGEGGYVIRNISPRSYPDRTTINELVARGTIPVRFVDQEKLSYKIDNEEEEDDE